MFGNFKQKNGVFLEEDESLNSPVPVQSSSSLSSVKSEQILSSETALLQRSMMWMSLNRSEKKVPLFSQSAILLHSKDLAVSSTVISRDSELQ
ncbi:hypothetical protein CEXT_737231 [Caerostris extrusa]|uniref:Uncharacterized protein n=1 Tax=Caerostris extrusa TaxID=172846 RepID=A0AAV4WSE9_CAEEX|nr:hypothetical protein CEXT_737231 [Caerostris extrusa]